MPPGYRSSWINVNGVRTHYWESGDDGPPVVLIHGGGAGISGEIGYGMMLEALAPHFRAYAPDQLSYGYTDRGPNSWPTRGLQSLVDHVSGFIDSLCLDTVHLVGNSQGAYVAAKYALDHPERVKKLFMIASGNVYQAMGGQGHRTAGPEREHAAYDGTLESMRRHLEFISYDKARLTDDVVKARHDVASLPGAKEVRKVFEAAMARRREDPDLTLQWSMVDTLPELKIPAMFAWGIDDNFAPVEWGYELEKLLPNIPFYFVERSGHQVQNDRPDAVNPMVIDFFSS